MSFGGEFLCHPDLFPGRRSGEPWGERRLVLDVPGGPYRFSGLAETQVEALRLRFGRLCRVLAAAAPKTAEAGVHTAVFRAPGADFRDLDTRGWEYTLDQDHAASFVRIAGLRLMARLDWAPDLTGGLWTPEVAGEMWVSVLENYLRLLVAYRLVAEGGVLLHSAGVSDGHWGWLLLGPSGAGKTTASRLCLAAGAEILSDDLNAARFPDGGGGPVVARLPFTGDLGERQGEPGAWPLRAVLRLRQGTAESLVPLSPAAAFAALVAAAPYVNRDVWRREPLLAALERLAHAVPAWELTFSLGTDLWSILAKIPP